MGPNVEESAVRERPILFSDPEVHAALASDTMQMRRTIKPQPSFDQVHDWRGKTVYDGEARCWFWRGRHLGHDLFDAPNCEARTTLAALCPYGKPGDRLWIREAWDDVHPLRIAEGRHSQPGDAGIPGPPPVDYRTVYRADGECPPVWHANEYPYRALKPGDADWARIYPRGAEYGWRPSVHMPRWASRILLEVTSVRVRAVQGITESTWEWVVGLKRVNP